MTAVPLTVAFAAGLVSFLSPCVLPLIPGFLTYLAGTTVTEAAAHRRTVFANSVAFVAGFASVFALLGVLLNTLLEAVAFDAQIWLARIGGGIIIFFGLFLMGIIRIPFLERELKVQVKARFSSRLLTSFVFGAAFAAGWTPCVGAVLGGILGLAASAPGIAFILLLSYALGLGLPFLAVGIFTAGAQQIIARIRPYLRYVNIVFGAILIVLGALAFTRSLGRYANLEYIMMLIER